jgi:saccharopine dehydrogenase-like NADP-dependent oxidoreductase
MPLEPLVAAIELGIDYIDISENRRFRNELIEKSDRIADAGIRVMNGFSVVRGMSALFAKHTGVDRTPCACWPSSDLSRLWDG